MSLISMANDAEWDFPIFKKLPRNDTGAAPGNQAGMVIPRDLRAYFPRLENTADENNPTVDRDIRAILYIDGSEVDRVSTRYQMQTWGGIRSETRITSNLGAMRNSANRDDYLFIQRNIVDRELYRLALFRQNTADHSYLQELTNGRRWGIVGKVRPATEHDFEQAALEEEQREEEEFVLIDADAVINETRSKRIARSSAFKNKVLTAYAYQCAITGESVRTPDGSYELEAAHIVPRSKRGSDDVRNGLALSRRLHWAFDRGLFSFDENRRIIVPGSVRNIPENIPIASLAGAQLRESDDQRFSAHQSALDWHRTNILLET